MRGARLMSSPRVLILGVSGMLGHALMNELAAVESLEVSGSARDLGRLRGYFSTDLLNRVTSKVDAVDMDAVRRLLVIV